MTTAASTEMISEKKIENVLHILDSLCIKFVLIQELLVASVNKKEC
jgi:hypothetical protein